MVEVVFPAEFSLHWGTYNFKLNNFRRTIGYILHDLHEQQSFARIVNGELAKDYSIVDHIGSGVSVHPGTFLARVVATARNAEDVQEGLELGRKMLALPLE